MKIILSRKGFDDKYGGHPSIIWNDTGRMLSFPIPIDKGTDERGETAERMHFEGLPLSQIFSDLNFPRELAEAQFHLDPEIQNLSGSFSSGSLGQSGSALGHLVNHGVGQGDIFLFFGTFSQCYLDKGRVAYEPMHPFHAIWGYLRVDHVITNVSTISDTNFPELLQHPHFINRGIDQYQSKNAIFYGRDYGTFTYSDVLRLTKLGYAKSYWSLPEVFEGLSISYNEESQRKRNDDRIEFKSASIGQEFVIDAADPKLDTWLNSVLFQKTPGHAKDK